VAISPAILAAVESTVAEATKKVNNPILPTSNEFFWAALTFVVLWALMKWVLLPPMLKIMEERAAKRREDLAAAEAASLQMDDARTQYEASLSGARADAVTKIEAARAEADQYRKEKLATAEADAAATRVSSAATVADARATALSELQGSITDIAVGAAEAVVERPIDREAQRPLIEEFVNRAEPGR
jgi:F-type H+-transporting ATPase subunit b